LISKNFWFSNSLVTNFFIFDFVAVFFKILVLIGALLCILVSTEFLTKQKIIFFEYTLLLFLSVLGMFLLTNSYNVVSLFLSLELQSFCFYILASYKRNSIYSTEAGLKYFLLGGFSTAVVLFGSSLLYGFTGTINFQELTLLAYSNWYSNFVISLSTLFILTGFLFKLGAFPFYAWVPDVYEGSPTSTSIFFAVSSKAALIVIAVRFLKINCNTNLFDWQSVILICGVFSILVGSFLAVKQKKIKRVLAYSSISHIGYLLLAMVTLSVEGFYSVFFLPFCLYVIRDMCVVCCFEYSKFRFLFEID
jgi:NADH-quinone oxidoreductase subunit N